jgi:hypothetical protein
MRERMCGDRAEVFQVTFSDEPSWIKMPSNLEMAVCPVGERLDLATGKPPRPARE